MIHLAVEGIVGSEIPLGIVAVGTGNDIAREFMLPAHDIESSVQQIMTAFMAKKYYLSDVIKIESESGTNYALAIASLGIDADVNQRANKMSWPRGNTRYFRAILPAIREYKPYGVNIRANGRSLAGSVTLLSIANTRYFGGGINVAPNASPNDGLLDVVLVGGLKLGTFGRLLPKLIMARHIDDNRVHYFQTNKIFVAPDLSKGIQPPSLMADGEFICNLPATISVLPGALKLAL
ncbi:diacylglycerol kinase family protein [Arcanobacterium hippocoleae]